MTTAALWAACGLAPLAAAAATEPSAGRALPAGALGPPPRLGLPPGLRVARGLDLGPAMRRLARLRPRPHAAWVAPRGRLSGGDVPADLPWWQASRWLGLYRPWALEAPDGRWLALDSGELPSLQPGRSQTTIGLDLGAGWVGDRLDPGPHVDPAPEPVSEGQPGAP